MDIKYCDLYDGVDYHYLCNITINGGMNIQNTIHTVILVIYVAHATGNIYRRIYSRSYVPST